MYDSIALQCKYTHCSSAECKIMIIVSYYKIAKISNCIVAKITIKSLTCTLYVVMSKENYLLSKGYPCVSYRRYVCLRWISV